MSNFITYNKIIKQSGNILQVRDLEKPLTTYRDVEKKVQENEENFRKQCLIDSAFRVIKKIKNNKKYDDKKYDVKREAIYNNGEVIDYNFIVYDRENNFTFNEVEYYIDKMNEDNLKHIKKVKNSSKNDSQSIRRARQTVFDYIQCNTDMRTFITLTFGDNKQWTRQGALDEFKTFIQRLRYHLDKIGIDFKYVAVHELHDKGDYHFHMICNLPVKGMSTVLIKDYVGKTEEHKALERKFADIIWKNGYVDIRQVNKWVNKKGEEKNATVVGAYITKYMTKQVENEEGKQIKSYLNSKDNLIKPTTYYYMDGVLQDIKNIEDLNEDLKGVKIDFDNLKERYKKEYTGEWTGTINLVEYDLIENGYLPFPDEPYNFNFIEKLV